MSDAIVFDSIAQSNIPAQAKKSIIRSWYERASGVGSAALQHRAVGHAREGFQAFRAAGEAGMTGGVLGLVDAEYGLDQGKDKNIPVDGVLAVVGYGASIIMAHDPTGISTDMRNVASDALSVLTYRKAKAWREKAKSPTSHPTVATHGEEDPIIAASKLL